MNVCVRSYHLRLNEQQSAFNLLLSTSIKEKKRNEGKIDMQRTARVCYIYIGAYSFETLTRSMRNEICYAQNTRLDGFMTSLFFLSIPALQLFLYFLSFYRYRKKCFFCLLYVPSHTRIAHRALQFRWFTCILSDY